MCAVFWHSRVVILPPKIKIVYLQKRNSFTKNKNYTMTQNIYSNERLTIFAIGGGGRNIAHTIQALSNDKAIDFILCDTDKEIDSSIENRIDIENPSDSSEIEDKIKPYLSNITRAVVITSLGGKTGTEMTPLLLTVLHQNGVDASCVATTPFAFEGENTQKALECLKKIREAKSALTVFENQTLMETHKDINVMNAFRYVDETIASIVFEQYSKS